MHVCHKHERVIDKKARNMNTAKVETTTTDGSCNGVIAWFLTWEEASYDIIILLKVQTCIVIYYQYIIFFFL